MRPALWFRLLMSPKYWCARPVCHCHDTLLSVNDDRPSLRRALRGLRACRKTYYYYAHNEATRAR